MLIFDKRNTFNNTVHYNGSTLVLNAWKLSTHNVEQQLITMSHLQCFTVHQSLNSFQNVYTSVVIPSTTKKWNAFHVNIFMIYVGSFCLVKNHFREEGQCPISFVQVPLMSCTLCALPGIKMLEHAQFNMGTIIDY